MKSPVVDFVHLHVHTSYSLLDSTIRLVDLLKKAKEYQMAAIAITDHGNLFGAIEFYKQAHKVGIKPIIGCELYVAPRSRFDKHPAAAGESSYHLLVLVKNMKGYKNLMSLVSAGYLEGFCHKPHVDKDLLQSHHNGLIATSACMYGEVASYILQGDRAAAAKAAREYQDIFGQGNFYLEIMKNGLPEQEVINKGILDISRRLSIPVVATNDCHYLHEDDAEIHEALQCIQAGKTLGGNKRKRPMNQFYLRSPGEMKRLFSYCPEAISNSVRIADRCNLNIKFGRPQPLQFHSENVSTPDEYLAKIANEGLNKMLPAILRNGDSSLRTKYEKRLRDELEIIKSKGYAGYLLIVADCIYHARRNGIALGPMRGVNTGSLVAYATGISNIDPIHHGLLFRLFLNPDNKNLPTIDMYISSEGRKHIIRYIVEKYGIDHVAEIVVPGKYRPKSALRDVAYILKIPHSDINSITKMIPDNLNFSLRNTSEMGDSLKEKVKGSKKIQRLLFIARELEGLIRHLSTHAAGVVISDKSLVDMVPLCRTPQDGPVSQYSIHDLDVLGIPKFNFLGLTFIDLINDTVETIKKRREIEIDTDTLHLDDVETYALLQKGKTKGIFQLGSFRGMTDVLVQLRPSRFEDLIALMAIFRPAVMNMIPDFIMRKRAENVNYVVPELATILEETYGIILYQEQVMQIANKIAGYSMVEADKLRRSLAEKIVIMSKDRSKFLVGAKRNGYQKAEALEIWKQITAYAQNRVSKSQSAAYAMLSYQTAYLKTHYPAEFMHVVRKAKKF